MYHCRKATLRVDKVFALLGMTSDVSIPDALSPNYEVPWKTLFKSLIKFVLQEADPVRTWDHCEVTIVTINAAVAGQVTSVTTSADTQNLEVKLRQDA